MEGLLEVSLEIFFSVTIIFLSIVFIVSQNLLVSGITFSLISLLLSFLFFKMGFEFVGILQTFFLIIPIFICLLFTKYLKVGKSHKNDRTHRYNTLIYIILLSILFGFLAIILFKNHEFLTLSLMGQSLNLNYNLFFKENSVTLSLLLILFMVLITGFLGLNLKEGKEEK